MGNGDGIVTFFAEIQSVEVYCEEEARKLRLVLLVFFHPFPHTDALFCYTSGLAIVGVYTGIILASWHVKRGKMLHKTSKSVQVRFISES